MVVWIPAGRSNGSEMPVAVVQVVDELASLATARLRDSGGGISRSVVVAEVVRRLAHVSQPSTKPDDVDVRTAGGVVVRVEAGRAHTNNEGVWATLTAAMLPGVQTLVLVLPDTYKGSKAAEHVEKRLQRLLGSPGVMVDLVGVAVVRY